jgi:hypothetical protein
MVLHLTPQELQDPARRLQRIAESLGVSVPHASLCPSDALTKMCRDADLDVPPWAYGSPLHLSNAIVGNELGEGGGGEDGPPAWVPADAKIHIDFLGGDPQGRAWVEGTGEVAIDTLLGNDANAEAGWGLPTGYSSSDLSAEGYAPPTATAFIGTARTLLLAGATMRLASKQKSTLSPPSAVPLALVAVDGVDAVQVDQAITQSAITVLSWAGAENASEGVLNSSADADNAVAITVTATRLEAAANGNITLAAITLTSSDRPPGNPLVAALFQFTNNYAVVQSITLYDPLPSTAGLSALSEA